MRAMEGNRGKNSADGGLSGMVVDGCWRPQVCRDRELVFRLVIRPRCLGPGAHLDCLGSALSGRTCQEIAAIQISRDRGLDVSLDIPS